MIVFFVGTPGSGKSYEAVKKIIDNLRIGRCVCTNIDGMDLPECQEYIKNLLGMDDFIFHTKFRYLQKDEILRFWETETIITPAFIRDFDNDVFEDQITETQELICPKGSLIVIDEAHKHFNARDWNVTDKDGRNPNKLLGDWASTHRHLGYDLVLITQHIDKVDKQVRTLTEWTYFFRKVNFFGGAVQKKYLCYSYSGDDHDGKPLAKNVRTYSPDIFPCYQSYSAADAKEVGFMAHTNILKHPVFYAIPVVLCTVLYMFFSKSSFASGDIFGVNKVQHKFDNVATKGMVKSAAPGAASPSPVMKNISSQTKQAPPMVMPGLPGIPLAVPGFPAAAPYIQYHVDGYIIDNGKTIVQINGTVVHLPSPHVQKFYKDSGLALAEVDFFGPPKNNVHSVSSQPLLKPAVTGSHSKAVNFKPDFGPTSDDAYKPFPAGTDYKAESVKSN